MQNFNLKMTSSNTIISIILSYLMC
uniref:Uncharacterized protein n=1 Tax=Arundo donax TaxID=35708 RepID=A0A0A9A0R6_ARUDO